MARDAPRSNFPRPDIYMGGRPLWLEEALDEYDEKLRARRAGHRCPPQMDRAGPVVATGTGLDLAAGLDRPSTNSEEPGSVQPPCRARHRIRRDKQRGLNKTERQHAQTFERAEELAGGFAATGSGSASSSTPRSCRPASARCPNLLVRSDLRLSPEVQ